MPPPSPKPRYVPITQAARKMGCHYETVARYVKAGRLSIVHPLGAGRGKPAKLLAAEVEAFVAAVSKQRDPWEAVRAVQRKAGAKPAGGGK